MPYVIGITLAVIVAALARVSRLDRDAAFYPTVLMVVASYYVLFGAMTGSLQTSRMRARRSVVVGQVGARIGS